MRPIIQARVDEWTEKNRKYAREGKIIDWAMWTQSLGCDIITELVFGAPLGFVSSESDVFELLGQYEKVDPYVAAMQHMPWLLDWLTKSRIGIYIMTNYLLPKPTDSVGVGKIIAVIHLQYFSQDTSKPVSGRRHRPPKASRRVNRPPRNPRPVRAPIPHPPPHTNHSNTCPSLLKSKNEDGTPMSIDMVKSELVFILLAGSGSVGITMSTVLLNLLRNPHVYTKLLTTDLSSANLAIPESQREYPYLAAAIKESLRLLPPFPKYLPRIVSRGGVVLPDGRLIPAGAEVTMNSACTGRDPAVFGDDAEEFVPERWLGSKEDVLQLEKYTQAWGYGPSQCIGALMILLPL